MTELTPQQQELYKLTEEARKMGYVQALNDLSEFLADKKRTIEVWDLFKEMNRLLQKVK